ncbi:MAG: hypothetical protein Q8Q09_29515 [Deltaproteobacteria bacterium]|nr:hypothetical protein [Deltaproteobacteria bacterium]
MSAGLANRPRIVSTPSQLFAQCPACGGEKSGHDRCESCGLDYRLGRWKREPLSILQIVRVSLRRLVKPVAALVTMVAIGMIAAVGRTGIAEISLGICVLAALASVGIPLALVVLGAVGRSLVVRTWRWDAHGEATCVARGTLTRVHRVIRVRTIAASPVPILSDLAELRVAHAGTLVGESAMSQALPFGRNPVPGPEVRERAEVCIALAIALAKLHGSGAISLVRSTSRRLDQDGTTVETSRVDTLGAQASPGSAPDDGLSRWLLSIIPGKNQIDLVAGYRDQPHGVGDAPGQAAALSELVQAAMLTMDSPQRVLRSLLAEQGPELLTRPALSPETLQALGELTALFWHALTDALRAQARGDAMVSGDRGRGH